MCFRVKLTINAHHQTLQVLRARLKLGHNVNQMFSRQTSHLQMRRQPSVITGEQNTVGYISDCAWDWIHFNGSITSGRPSRGIKFNLKSGFSSLTTHKSITVKTYENKGHFQLTCMLHVCKCAENQGLQFIALVCRRHLLKHNNFPFI